MSIKSPTRSLTMGEDFYRSPARNGWTRRMTETNCWYNHFQTSFFFLFYIYLLVRELPEGERNGSKMKKREEERLKKKKKRKRGCSLLTSLSPRPLTWPRCTAQRQAPFAGKGRIDRSAAVVILMTATPALSVPIRLSEVPTQCWGDSALHPPGAPGPASWDSGGLNSPKVAPSCELVPR